jgi:hypothetical protein
MSDSDILYKNLLKILINNLLLIIWSVLIEFLKSPFADDLLRFSGSINVYDGKDQDTLWARVFIMSLKEMRLI